MITDSYKTQTDFENNCNCAFAIYNFIDNIDSSVRWFFKRCYVLDNHNQYIVELSSYDTPEYKNFKATITATYNPQKQIYNIELTNKYEPL